MNVIIQRVFIALFFLCFVCRATAYDDWRRLSVGSVQGQSWRDVTPTKFLSVRLDMDGDGKKDVAAIVVSHDLRKSAIRVCFGGATKKQQCKIVAISENIADVMGLEQKNPGCYAYTEDDAGRSSHGKQICGRGDVLEYFKFGSASSFFVYDIETDTFGRYWDSD